VRLWLVADNDRKPFPKFLEKEGVELAKHVNKVVNTFVQHEDKRDEELRGGAFLEKDTLHIVDYLSFGQRIWGEGSGAETRLMSNQPEPGPALGGVSKQTPGMTNMMKIGKP
jgi:hypothetical protein